MLLVAALGSQMKKFLPYPMQLLWEEIPASNSEVHWICFPSLPRNRLSLVISFSWVKIPFHPCITSLNHKFSCPAFQSLMSRSCGDH